MFIDMREPGCRLPELAWVRRGVVGASGGAGTADCRRMGRVPMRPERPSLYAWEKTGCCATNGSGVMADWSFAAVFVERWLLALLFCRFAAEPEVADG